jgi:hypothetical protein
VVAIIGPALSAAGRALSNVTPREIALTRTLLWTELQPKRGSEFQSPQGHE